MLYSDRNRVQSGRSAYSARPALDYAQKWARLRGPAYVGQNSCQHGSRIRSECQVQRELKRAPFIQRVRNLSKVGVVQAQTRLFELCMV